MITGTISNYVQMQSLNNNWEKKKNSGNILSKDERNERANWTQDQRMLNDFKEQLDKEKESSRRHEIANKISSGQKLSPDEEQYLASYDPQALSDYRQTQSERKAYEDKLKNCKTKDEVEKLKTSKIGHELASLNKIVNDPYISISEKLKKAQQALGKTLNIQEAEREFIESGEFDKLPTEAEMLISDIKEKNLEQEAARAEATEAETSEIILEQEKKEPEKIVLSEADRKKDDPAKEIKKIYNHLNMSQHMEDKFLDKSINMILGINVNISA